MPYGKIHESFFSSSIVETDIETRFVFISMIVLSDKDGRLDITRQALARRINTPLEIVNRAIEVLMAPDEISRTADHQGRRLLPLDPARPWGWVVVNKATYRHSSDDDQREQARERKRKQRERDRQSKEPVLSNPNPDADTDTDTHTDTDSHAGHVVSRKKRDRRQQAERPEGFGEIVAKLRALGIIKRGTSPQQQLISEWTVTPGTVRILAILDANRDRILAADRPFSYLGAIVRADREPLAAADRGRTNPALGGDDDFTFDLHS